MATRRLRVPVVCLPPALLVAAVGWMLCAEKAQAQKAPYSTFEIGKIIRAEDSLTAAEAKILDEYFDGFFLGLFKKPLRPTDLPNLRNKVYKNVMRNAGKTAARDYVNEKLFKEMFGILGSKSFDKTIKYNAMLMIADLNESEGFQNIKPLPKALPLLTQVAFVDMPEYDYLKPAALIGLIRYAEEGGIPQNQQAELTGKLLKLVKQKDPPPNLGRSVHNYMRRSAARALAALGSTGPNNSVVKAFEAIAADPAARPTMRCEMARCIAKLDIRPEAKVDLRQLANIVGHLTVELCKQETDRAEGEKKDASRRFILYVLDSGNEALRKLTDAADGDARQFIYELKKKVDDLYRKLDDPDDTSDDQVGSVVATEIITIEDSLLPKPEPEQLVASGADAASTK